MIRLIFCLIFFLPHILSGQENLNYGDIVISEIMADPSGLTQLPKTEYVEIYNTRNEPVSLKGLSFVYVTNENSSTISLLPDTVLPSYGYAVLFRTGREILSDINGIILPIDNFSANLANAGKHLQLKDSLDQLIDSVTYSKAKPAKSWERGLDGIWYLSTDPRGGTPGATNSLPEEPPVILPPDFSEPGDVLINEVMANPVGLTLLPETEYIELYNASDSAVSLCQWTFIYDGKPYLIPDTVLQSGAYAVLFREGQNIFVDQDGIALAAIKFPVLSNDGKSIGILNSNGVVIDTVTYGSSKKACAWERDTEGIWYYSTDPRGGTPGSVNSSKSVPQPPVENPNDYSKPGDVIINEVMANPKGLVLLPETEYIEILNVSDSTFILSGWTFIYGDKSYLLPDTVLPAGQFAVLYRKGRDISIDNTGMDLSFSEFPANLANAGKTLQLKNSSGTILDNVTYQKATPAQSWERNTTGEWHLSGDPRGGTPGSVNSSGVMPQPPVINVPDNSKAGDIIINEIMANPVGLTDLPETEYVEIYNVSTAQVTLYQWSFLYDGKTFAIPDTVLQAGAFAILFHEGQDIAVDQGGIALAVEKFPVLSNAGKTIGILNSKGIVIDTVTYRSSKRACAWEREMDGLWYYSTDSRGGTPGSINSSKTTPEYPEDIADYTTFGDIIINEIMANPNGLIYFPETEYIELYNQTDSDVVMINWSLIYDERIIPLPDTVIQSKKMAVLYRSGRDIYIESNGMNIPVESFPANLSNAGKKLEIRNKHDILIDSFSYAPAKAARSWERDSVDQWYLSTDPRGGTPGGLNSIYGTINPPVIPEKPEHTDSTKFHDLIINEIMANPSGLILLPETEYVEIYNNSDKLISLKNWSFIYDTRSISLPDVSIEANQYAVLFRTGRDIYVEDTGFAVSISDFPANLSNSGKSLQLRNSLSEIIDSVRYAPAKAGLSWERNTNGEWYLSTDVRGGTPGSKNSDIGIIQPPTVPGNPSDTLSPVLFPVYEKEFIINEILPDPYPGGSEYIELYNRSNRPLSCSNLSIAVRKGDGTLGTSYPLRSITDSIYPNSYVVLTTNQMGVIDFYNDSSPENIYELKLPGLNNSGTTLVLFQTSDNSVIDQVSYTSKWHDIAIKNTKGVSLERIDPDQDTQSETNWTSATSMAGYGTPGYQNSQYGLNDEIQRITLNKPEFQPESSDYIIAYQTDKPGYRCRIAVYTVDGRKVAEIINNRLIGMSGEIRWNGYGSDGIRLLTGVYVFFGELYHPEGKKKTFKNAFLIKQ